MTDVAGGPPIPESLDFDNGDLNGACFVVGAEGEAEILTDTNLVVIPPGCPVQTVEHTGEAIAYTSAQSDLLMFANFAKLVEAGRTEEVAARVAYLRFLSVRQGYMSPNYDPVAHNVKYNHCVNIDATEYARLRALVSAAGLAAIRASCTVQVRATMRRNFMDYVCCVAYIFRVRGHHYKAEIEDRYKTLWSRCLKDPGEVVLPWMNIATDSLHAIMPDVLDDVWGYAVTNARCAGTLCKRWDSAPAGSAGIAALRRGLEDVMMLFPRVVERVPVAYAEFVRLNDLLEGSRWGGSINNRFYGVPRIRIDEGKVGALASVVMGVYEQLAPDSRLRESPALKRLAEIAPATGGAIGNAANKATRSEAFSLISEVRALPASVAPT
jgi:hypothetical protein